MKKFSLAVAALAALMCMGMLVSCNSSPSDNYYTVESGTITVAGTSGSTSISNTTTIKSGFAEVIEFSYAEAQGIDDVSSNYTIVSISLNYIDDDGDSGSATLSFYKISGTYYIQDSATDQFVETDAITVSGSTITISGTVAKYTSDSYNTTTTASLTLKKM